MCIQNNSGRKPTIDEIADAFNRLEWLEELDIKELCEELNVPYNLTNKKLRNNLIADAITAEYGPDMLPYVLCAMDRWTQLHQLHENYPHTIEHVLLYEHSPIIDPALLELDNPNSLEVF